MTIKFQKHYVTNGVTKARVSYSFGQVFVKQPGGSRPLRDCITLYAKDYNGTLGKVLPENYENDSDSQTDYIVEGLARIFPGDALYAAAKARCDAWEAVRKVQRNLYDAKLAARRAVMYGQPTQVAA